MSVEIQGIPYRRRLEAEIAVEIAEYQERERFRSRSHNLLLDLVFRVASAILTGLHWLGVLGRMNLQMRVFSILSLALSVGYQIFSLRQWNEDREACQRRFEGLRTQIGQLPL